MKRLEKGTALLASLAIALLAIACQDEPTGPEQTPSFLHTGGVAQVSFASPVNLPLNRPTNHVAVGDFNGDAIPDIAAGFNTSDFFFSPPFAASRFAIYLGTGGGSFGSPTIFDPGTGFFPGTGCGVGQAPEVADVNNDGFLDVVMTHNITTSFCFGNRLTVHLGDGAGGFATPGIQLFTGGTPRGVAIGDFNEDGNLDLAIGNSDQGSIFIHLGTGSGSFFIFKTISLGSFPLDLRARDLNADGHLDVITAGPQGKVKVLFGTGGGIFPTIAVFSVTGGAIAVTTGDYNEDGIVDFAATSNTLGTANIFLGTGGGSFSAPVSFPVIPSGLLVALETEDFNGDGHQDLAMAHVVAGSPAGNVSVLPGDGIGGFGLPFTFSSSAATVGHSRAADLNVDGLPDLVATSVNPTGVSILLNITAQTPAQATEDVIDELGNLVEADPGSPLADKLNDAIDKLQTALDELNKIPPDNQAALGAIEGAVGDVEAAVKDGLLDAAQGTEIMDELAGAARQLAESAIEDATARGGDPVKIVEAEDALAEGDALRDAEAFKDAVNKYKDALAKAEGA